jgi:hypothetical protein
MKNLHNRYKRFKEWEQQPHQVAPLSEDHHECATCGTHYEGNKTDASEKERIRTISEKDKN